MAKYGMNAALKFHETNTGSLPYTPIKLPDNGSKVKVRILAKGSPPTDPETGDDIFQDDERYIVSLYFHKKFKVLNERCPIDSDTADPANCPLCRVKAPRTIATFIPMRERGDKERDRVKWMVIGREMLQRFISAQEEIPNHDLTGIDFVIKRVGKGTATQYELYPQANTAGPLGADERALEFPEPDDMIPVKSPEELEKLALDYERAQSATKTGGGDEEEEELERVPF